MTPYTVGDERNQRFTHDYWRDPVVIASTLPPLTSAIDATEFRLFADAIPTLCWMARADGYIVWYNRRWHQYCGTTPAAMEGWGWQSVHDPAELPHVLDGWRGSIASGEPFEMVFPLRGADGTFRPFMTRVAPIRDDTGAIVRWFGVNTEIVAQIAAESALDATRANYEVLTDAMPQMVWSTRPDGFHDYHNRQWYAFTGVPPGSTDGTGWSDLVHPDDRPRAWTRWLDCLESGAPYEIEFRLRHHSGCYRWTLGRALPVRDTHGLIVRWIGTCTDTHEVKLAAERNEILGRELSHRIKNIFAIIGGLIRLSARRDPAVGGFARDLQQRIAALGRAHDFARPHSEQSRPEAGGTLRGLLDDLLRPYSDTDASRIDVSGDDVPLDEKGATPIALVFHELATNAAKYGALAAPDGHVAVTISRRGDDLVVAWEERGGPTIAALPAFEGFGTKLASMSVEQQLGGHIVRRWEPAGLCVSIVVPVAQLVRSAGH